MKLPPAYHFPTTTVLIDDDEDFIDALQRELDSDQTIISKFNDPKNALDFLQRNLSPKNWSGGWTRISPSENDFDSVAIEIKFSKISAIINDKERFNQITTIVVDYQMPGIDGLSFLGMLEDFPARKILLTGVADAEIAVKALDKGLIDAYIKKQDVNLLEKIQKNIVLGQTKYFEEQSRLINLALKIAQENNYTLCASYYDIFEHIKTQYKINEHYLLDEYGSCMFLNKDTKRIDLIVKSRDQISCEEILNDSDGYSLEKREHQPLSLGSDYYYTIKAFN